MRKNISDFGRSKLTEVDCERKRKRERKVSFNASSSAFSFQRWLDSRNTSTRRRRWRSTVRINKPKLAYWRLDRERTIRKLTEVCEKETRPKSEVSSLFLLPLRSNQCVRLTQKLFQAVAAALLEESERDSGEEEVVLPEELSTTRQKEMEVAEELRRELHESNRERTTISRSALIPPSCLPSSSKAFCKTKLVETHLRFHQSSSTSAPLQQTILPSSELGFLLLLPPHRSHSHLLQHHLKTSTSAFHPRTTHPGSEVLLLLLLPHHRSLVPPFPHLHRLQRVSTSVPLQQTTHRD